MTTFRAPVISGVVRLGTPDDYALSHIPGVLRRVAETHPAVQVDVLCSSSSDLVERLKANQLDLTLVSDGTQPRSWPSVALWRGPVWWVTSAPDAPPRRGPLPLGPPP